MGIIYNVGMVIGWGGIAWGMWGDWWACGAVAVGALITGVIKPGGVGM